ncbi:MAG: Gfo/Idh/MocA family oxidoreductase [Chloroflexota bacterium]
MTKLRCGFVGGGTIMRVHAGLLQKRNDVDLVAVSDVSETVLNTAADMFYISGRYADYKDMVSQENLDFMVVGVPNAFHAGATLAGLQGGCHVLCEKPPALNVSQAKEMAAEAEKQGKRLAFGLHQRFIAAVETGYAYREAGRLGEVYHASVQMFRRRGIPGLGSWFTTKAVSGGGALIDVGVHELDQAHYLMGQPKPVTVSAVTHAPFGTDPENYNYLRMWGVPVPGGPFDVEDLASALIRFENGASMMLQVSWAANTPQTAESRIMGTKGGLYINADGLKVITEDNGFNADISPMYNPQEPKEAQMEHFIDCIRNPEKPLRMDGQQGVVLQAMLDAIYESAELGREVAVDLG